MIVPVDKIQKFKLSESFMDLYRDRQPVWGFGALSYVTYKRTYARPIDPNDPDSPTEEYWQTCQRVIEGMFTVQKAHCAQFKLPWDNRKAQRSAQEAYSRMFLFKWTPPGRGMFTMGTDFVYERGSACLFNCAFISTDTLKDDMAEPFCWTLLMLAHGTGVGYDTKGAGTVRVSEPRRGHDVFRVADSREGWSEAVERLIGAFGGKGSIPLGWDLSGLRDKGSKILGLGGTASGPEPLLELLTRLEKLWMSYVGKEVSSTLIVDTFNLIGKCVVSGGSRRSAMLSLGSADDDEFMSLKSDQEKLMDYRWASNNSIDAKAGMDFTKPAKLTAINGEPGYLFMDNAREYGRMCEPRNFKDMKVAGFNPCGEMAQESGETCNVADSYPNHHETLDDFKKTLKYAYLYAKTVTLIPTHSAKTNAITMKNRRIGLSMSGVAQIITQIGVHEFTRWMDEAYKYIQELDEIYSDWLCIPRSKKTTTLKPGGTTGIVAGVTPGGSNGFSEYHFRLIRIKDDSPIWRLCEEAGYKVEDCQYAPYTKVVYFPVHMDSIERDEDEIPMWEQASTVALLQAYWADNGVSCTVKFNKNEAKDIHRVLEHYQDKLKGISFLPHSEHGYVQAPYQKITKEEYEEAVKRLEPLDLSSMNTREEEDKFCTGDSCVVDFTKK